MTGIRLWIPAVSSFGSHVIIAATRIDRAWPYVATKTRRRGRCGVRSPRSRLLWTVTIEWWLLLQRTENHLSERCLPATLRTTTSAVDAINKRAVDAAVVHQVRHTKRDALTQGLAGSAAAGVIVVTHVVGHLVALLHALPRWPAACDSDDAAYTSGMMPASYSAAVTSADMLQRRRSASSWTASHAASVSMMCRSRRRSSLCGFQV